MNALDVESPSRFDKEEIPKQLAQAKNSAVKFGQFSLFLLICLVSTAML